MVKGYSNRVIASPLGVSEKTVKAHLARVFTAIDVSDRTQAVMGATKDHGFGEASYDVGPMTGFG